MISSLFVSVQTSEGKALKDFKTTKHVEDVKAALREFISENPGVKVSKKIAIIIT